MNKKLIIQLVIIIVAFGAAGVVLYNGFFSNGPKLPSGFSAGMVTSTATTPEELLPYGNKLDFSILHSRPFQFSQINYPVLSPQNDVGVPENNLITSQQ